MARASSPDPDKMAQALARGDRRTLARAITLVESTRPDHRDLARQLLERLNAHDSVARRIGLSGTPGVGKSTFIEALGLHLTGQGHRVAVLAVDPSSTRSGGSILGDKTRMEQLSRDPNAFIRPSPSLGALGGVARRTRETIRLVEAAGFDTVLVETVGVGQSETMVAEMTDIFTLLLAPAGGDELQGVKRGIMEIADLVIINKADGDLKAQAERTRADYAGALRLMRRRSDDPDGYPCALSLSSVTGDGLAEAWDKIAALHAHRVETDQLAPTRAAQAVSAMNRALEAGVLQALMARPDLADAHQRLLTDVRSGTVDPEAAAEQMIARIVAQ